MSYQWSDVNLYGTSDKVYGAEALSQAIHNMIKIVTGDIVLQPEIGCKIESLLFEPMDDFTAKRILIETGECISRLDPRIRMAGTESSITPYPDENMYEIHMVVEIVLSEAETEKFEQTFTLDRFVI